MASRWSSYPKPLAYVAWCATTRRDSLMFPGSQDSRCYCWNKIGFPHLWSDLNYGVVTEWIKGRDSMPLWCLKLGPLGHDWIGLLEWSAVQELDGFIRKEHAHECALYCFLTVHVYGLFWWTSSTSHSFRQMPDPWGPCNLPLQSWAKRKSWVTSIVTQQVQPCFCCLHPTLEC